MSTHFVALAVSGRKWTWHPSDRYGGGQFGFLIKLPDDTIGYGGRLVTLEDQSFWINVQVNESQVNKPIFTDTLKKLQDLGQGSFNLVSTGGRFNTTKKNTQSLKFSLSGFRLLDSLPSAVNKVILDVHVTEVRDRWLLVTEFYRIPNPKPGEKNYGERPVWVYLPEPMSLSPRQPVYVEGHVAGRWPTGEKNLYVIADLVV